MNTITLPLDQIRVDGATQPRAFLDFATVDDYTDLMQAGVKFPAVEVFFDGSDYWCADGFHRHRAARQCELIEIECNIHQGTLEDAQWFSFAANKSHGLRRTNDDKQRAVKAALAHPKSAGLSDHQIAKHVGVDVKTVGNWRVKLSMEIPQIESRTVTRNGTTYKQDVTNIGRRVDMTPRPVQDEAKPQLGRRQQIIENAHKQRMIDGLCHLRGFCLGIDRLNMQAIISGCTTEERGSWAAMLEDQIAKLRQLPSNLRGGERSRGRGVA